MKEGTFAVIYKKRGRPGSRRYGGTNWAFNQPRQRQNQSLAVAERELEAIRRRFIATGIWLDAMVVRTS